MADALFRPLTDGTFLPSDVARGPWSPDALHGGPVAALLAMAAEAQLADHDVQPVRLSVDLLRPVPSVPLTVHTEVVRPGRNVGLVAVGMLAGHTEVATATVLAIRTAAVPVPDQDAGGGPPPPELGIEPANDARWEAFHFAGVEHRIVAGSWSERGPATDWIRLRVPVVADIEPSPFQRVVAAADFGNGISSLADFETTSFINPDLTVYLHRPPVDEWVCLDAVSTLEPNGVGFAESALHDRQGRIGRAAQSLLVDQRS